MLSPVERLGGCVGWRLEEGCVVRAFFGFVEIRSFAVCSEEGGAGGE